MIYHLYLYLSELGYKVPGMQILQYISVRFFISMILSLFISTIFGKTIINFLKKKQIGESVRELGLVGEENKKGTPTMGGIIILISIIIPTLLLANLNKTYIRLMLLSTVWLGLIGFLDDYFKIKARLNAKNKGDKYTKKDSDGLAAKTKILGQIGLGIIVSLTLYFTNSVTVYREVFGTNKLKIDSTNMQNNIKLSKQNYSITDTIKLNNNLQYAKRQFVEVKSPITTLPFVKNHELNYEKLISWLGKGSVKYTWVIYMIIITIIIIAVSNGANITDGLDGLASGVSLIVASVLGIFIYLSGNLIYAEYLNITYIPNLGEVSIFIAALIGSCIGFLWYNSYPAQVFMGDTGSLALGGIIAVLAIIVRKEFLLPILCFIFLVENLSVILQVSYFKFTKRRSGQGRRLFLMSPIHHHFQKKGLPENKIVIRFWIISIIFGLFCLLTLKLR